MKFCIHFRNRLASVLSIPILNMGFCTLTPIWLCTTSVHLWPSWQEQGEPTEVPPAITFCNAHEGCVNHFLNLKTVIYHNAVMLSPIWYNWYNHSFLQCHKWQLHAACCMFVFNIFFCGLQECFQCSCLSSFFKDLLFKEPFASRLAVASHMYPQKTPSGGCERVQIGTKSLHFARLQSMRKQFDSKPSRMRAKRGEANRL